MLWSMIKVTMVIIFFIIDFIASLKSILLEKFKNNK